MIHPRAYGPAAVRVSLRNCGSYLPQKEGQTLGVGIFRESPFIFRRRDHRIENRVSPDMSKTTRTMECQDPIYDRSLCKPCGFAPGGCHRFLIGYKEL